MTPDDLLHLIGSLCVAYQHSTAARLAATGENDPDRQRHHHRQQQRWDEIAADRQLHVDRAVRAAFPAPITAEDFMPVRPLPDGKVELRAVDTCAQPVAVHFTGTEALNLGARLTICAAISLDRIGVKPDTELTPLPAPAPAAPVVPAPRHRWPAPARPATP